MDRRTLLGLFLAVPAIVACNTQPDPIPPIEKNADRGPVDTDDPYYDEWLDDYNKDSMHLD